MGGIPAVAIRDGALFLNVRNVGRGPALHVRAKLAEDESGREAHRSTEVVAPDGYTSLSWPDFKKPSLPKDSLPVWTHAKGSITCLDVSYATYTTEFVIGFAPDGRLQMVDVHVKPIPVLPPSGWLGRLSIAYLNARFDLARVRSQLAAKVARRGLP